MLSVVVISVILWQKHAVRELTLKLNCGGNSKAADEAKAAAEAKAKAEAEAKAAAEKAAAEKAVADAKVVILNRDYFTICVFFLVRVQTQLYKQLGRMCVCVLMVRVRCRFGEWKASKLMPF